MPYWLILVTAQLAGPALAEEAERNRIEIPEPERKPQGEFLVADLNVRGHRLPNALPLLLDFVHSETNIGAAVRLERVPLHDLKRRSPILVYFAGGGVKLNFSHHDREALRSYLDDGGLIYAAALNEGSKGSVYQQVQSLIEGMFGTEKAGFEPISKDHELFSSYFDFSDGPPISRPRRRLRSGRNLEVFNLRGRTVAILSDLNLSPRWVNDQAVGHLRALQFGTNLIAFAVTNRLGGDLR